MTRRLALGVLALVLAAGWAGSTVRVPVTEAPAVVPTIVSSGASALKVARE